MRWCLNLVAKSFPQAIVLSDSAPIQTASRQQSPSVSCSVLQVVFGVSWMLLQYNLSNWHPELHPSLPLPPVDLKYSWHLSMNMWDLL